MTNDGPPLAFSGTRLAWADLPRRVRDRIQALAGAEVVAEAPTTTGFSPGYASLLDLGDGTQVFVKAVSPEQNRWSTELARAEVRAAALLPSDIPAPRLLWHDDDGEWVVLGMQALPGRPPTIPWLPEELARVLALVTLVADLGTPAPPGLPSFTDALTGLGAGAAALAADAALAALAADAVGEHGPWLAEHVHQVAADSARAPELVVGHTLAHNDLRADNVMLCDDQGWLVDWPHAAAGAPRWWDLLGMLPSVAMQGGGDPDAIFWGHPTAVDADPVAVRAGLSTLTGYFVHGALLPAPPGMVNLRPFQLAQGRAVLDWLRRL